MAGGTDSRYVVPGEAIGVGVRDDAVQRPLPGVPIMAEDPSGNAVIIKSDANGNIVTQVGDFWRANRNTTVSAGTITTTIAAVTGQILVLDMVAGLGDNIFANVIVQDAGANELIRFNIGNGHTVHTGGYLANVPAGEAMTIKLQNLSSTGALSVAGRVV